MKKVEKTRPGDDMPAMPSVRTTGRIKKPKLVYDPSDYTPRVLQRRDTYMTAEETAVKRKSAAERATTPTSDNSSNINKRGRTSSLSSSFSAISDAVNSSAGADLCFVCNKVECKRGMHAKNKLIACVACDKKVHKQCSDVEISINEDSPALNDFKCSACRTCIVCDMRPAKQQLKNSFLVTCCKCYKSFHFDCQSSNVTTDKPSLRNYICKQCLSKTTDPVLWQNMRKIIGTELQKDAKKDAANKEIVAAAAASSKPTASSSSTTATVQTKIETKTVAVVPAVADVQPIEERPQTHKTAANGVASKAAKRFNPYEQMDIPDVKKWSVEEVFTFFKQYFKEEANVLKEQEIDGASLLLLKRSDVIKKLPIKLGPALHLFSLILKIQTKNNDPTLAWQHGSSSK